jgi:hypothetical protein
MQSGVKGTFFHLQEIIGDGTDVIAQAVAMEGAAGVEGTEDEEG